jgi:DNA-directed RNA polymerase specialized sigma24 family protein
MPRGVKTSDRLAGLMAAGSQAVAADLIASHLKAARRQARWYQARYPGHDVEPLVMQALYLAAYDFQPGKGTFYWWFRRKLHGRFTDSPPRLRFGTVSCFLLDWIPAPDDGAKPELLEALAAALAALTPLENLVIRRRYGLDSGRAEGLRRIGDDLGYSHEGIRKAQRRALRKLRGHLRTGEYQEVTA